MDTPQYGEPEFLCYQVIKKIRDQYGDDHDLPKTDFHKLCYIADKKLREESVDIELPVHWYMYGGVITDDAMQTDFYELEEKSWKEYSGENVVLSDDIDESDFATDEDHKNEIETVAEDMASEFGGHYGTVRTQDYQYQNYAPNDFVRTLHEFRKFVQDLDNHDRLSADKYVGGVGVSFEDFVSEDVEGQPESVTPNEEINQELRTYLDELISTYPDEQYSRMESQFLDWENISWQMAKNGFYSQLQSFMEEFWKTFSRVELRIQHNRNLPLRIKSQWRNEIPEEIERFELKINNFRTVVLDNREETHVLDTVSDSFSNTVREMFDQRVHNE